MNENQFNLVFIIPYSTGQFICNNFFNNISQKEIATYDYTAIDALDKDKIYNSEKVR